MTTYLIAAIIIGFAGSFHCVGMCGPIALMLPVQWYSGWTKLFAIVWYNTGRVLSYTILGALFGLVGKAFVLSGYQQLLSVSLGILLLIALFAGSVFNTMALWKPFVWVKQQLSLFMATPSLKALLMVGVLNGLLPCGLVYMAIAGAVAVGSWYGGALFMAGFGLGTIPAMVALSWFGHMLPLSFRQTLRKASPIVVTIMAVCLILRGLNLGIPYISPKLSTVEHAQRHCCDK